MTPRTKTFLKRSSLVAAGLAAALGLFVAVGVRASDHPTRPSDLGRPASSSTMDALIDQPGPLTVESVVSADWKVDRSGLINLGHPTARAAGLRDGLEPIEIYLHVVRHPTRGRFLIDTGVERALRDDPSHAAIRGAVADAMHAEYLHVRRDTASVVAAEGPLAGVFLTHLHLDHVSGMPDIPRGTALYAGPGETSQRFFLNAFVKGTTDRELAGHAAIQEWRFARDPGGRFEGVVDVFGDGSLFALWVPGHTAGSTAYLARTTTGPVLFAGDTCHTAWGWANGVEPGDFTRDRARNVESLRRLRALVAAHPRISVRLGHQHLGESTALR
ncbi:MAG: MBL fold metallo-hydrolase [Polyangiales bacterium]